MTSGRRSVAMVVDALEPMLPGEGIAAAMEARDQDDPFNMLAEEQAVGEAAEPRTANVPKDDGELSRVVEDASDLMVDLCTEGRARPAACSYQSCAAISSSRAAGRTMRVDVTARERPVQPSIRPMRRPRRNPPRSPQGVARVPWPEPQVADRRQGCPTGRR